ncbi:MAG: hypothetical protein KatS3mg096_613 [Candidatus Parcubacteria bacterium]|nr:MAG: hypothetical protein KatS3mg096_613 [Candidatus Parcubacteria bacterium]
MTKLGKFIRILHLFLYFIGSFAARVKLHNYTLASILHIAFNIVLVILFLNNLKEITGILKEFISPQHTFIIFFLILAAYNIFFVFVYRRNFFENTYSEFDINIGISDKNNEKKSDDEFEEKKSENNAG